MNFVWPQYLWLLLVVPVLVAAYVALLRRKKIAVRYANLGMVKAAMSPTQRFRRHVPPLLFLLAIVGALIAVARPSAVVTLPSDARTIILAMDVSLSMRATDIEPNRIIAAQNAAKAFVKRAAARHPRRYRDLRRDRVGRAAAHAEPRGPDRRDRPVRAAAAYGDRQRHHRIAGDDLSGRRPRPREFRVRQRIRLARQHAAQRRRTVR